MSTRECASHHEALGICIVSSIFIYLHLFLVMTLSRVSRRYLRTNYQFVGISERLAIHTFAFHVRLYLVLAWINIVGDIAAWQGKLPVLVVVDSTQRA